MVKDKNIIWQKILAEMKLSLSDIVYESMILPLSPVSYINETLTVLAASDFYKSSVTRYKTEITRCLRDICGEDADFQVVTQPDLDEPSRLKRTDNYAKTGLRPKYTFDNFVSGKCNELAYAASRAIADSPAKTEGYNPLFLYGDVGLGKTHLIHSIGNQVHDSFPNKKVFYVSAAIYTDEFITAIREKTTPAFRKKYRSIDVFLMDDVQFLAGKVETQEELFHMFNYLTDLKRQIVFTSDVPPNELKGLEERLTSRFAQGLTADLSIPSYETRAAILEKKLTLENFELSVAVKEFILNNIVSNIRDMEGALNKIMAMSRLTNEKITTEFAKKALKDLISGVEKPVISVDYISRVVTNYFNISMENLCSRSRHHTILVPRQIAMYLSRKLTDSTQPEVAKFFGGKDHSTVIHSCKKISDALETDEKIRSWVDDLENKIRGD